MRWTPSLLLVKVRLLAADVFGRRLHAPGEKAKNLDEGDYFAHTTFASVFVSGAGGAFVLWAECSFGP